MCRHKQSRLATCTVHYSIHATSYILGTNNSQMVPFLIYSWSQFCGKLSLAVLVYVVDNVVQVGGVMVLLGEAGSSLAMTRMKTLVTDG